MVQRIINAKVSKNAFTLSQHVHSQRNIDMTIRKSNFSIHSISQENDVHNYTKRKGEKKRNSKEFLSIKKDHPLRTNRTIFENEFKDGSDISSLESKCSAIFKKSKEGNKSDTMEDSEKVRK